MGRLQKLGRVPPGGTACDIAIHLLDGLAAEAEALAVSLTVAGCAVPHCAPYSDVAHDATVHPLGGAVEATAPA